MRAQSQDQTFGRGLWSVTISLIVPLLSVLSLFEVFSGGYFGEEVARFVKIIEVSNVILSFYGVPASISNCCDGFLHIPTLTLNQEPEETIDYSLLS